MSAESTDTVLLPAPPLPLTTGKRNPARAPGRRSSHRAGWGAVAGATETGIAAGIGACRGAAGDVYKRQGEAMAVTGRIEREVHPDLFAALVNCIVGQQIATKAQTTIWNRMLERFGEVTPEAMAACSDDELQQVGISFRKVGYIKGAAARVLSGEVDLEGLAELSDDEVCLSLIHISTRYVYEQHPGEDVEELVACVDQQDGHGGVRVEEQRDGDESRHHDGQRQPVGECGVEALAQLRHDDEEHHAHYDESEYCASADKRERVEMCIRDSSRRSRR